MRVFSSRFAGYLLAGTMVVAAPLMLAGCGKEEETMAQQPEQSEQKILSGEVMYRERMALPPGATVTVTLADVSRMDAPAQVIAQQHIDNPGAVPIPFELRYQAEAITSTVPMAYAVRAEIRAEDGSLLWTTTQRHTVELAGETAPESVSLMLEKTPRMPVTDQE